MAAVVGCMGVAYAADLGGIQETVRLWLGGEQVEAQLVMDPESETSAYELYDENGEVIMGGGGVAIEDDGTERPLTAEEIMGQFNNYVDRDENGTIWLYDNDQAYDITELMADGACNVVVKDADGNSNYYEIEYNDAGGYGFSCNTTPQLPEEEYAVL